jgi:O-acetyl-ADP-ribose deacetylase
MKLEVMVGDLTTASVEAIVNAANSDLDMGGGLAGAIKRTAGEDVETEAIAQGPINPGESVVTSAGALKAPIRWVIHAATMGTDRQTSETYIRMATVSALAAAARIGAKSIGYPALGTGVGRFPLNHAAEVMVEAILSAPPAAPVERVVFVVRNFDAMMAFEEAVARRR